MTGLLLGALLACDRADCGDREQLRLVAADDSERAICAAVASSARERRAGLTAWPPLEADQGLLLDFPVTDQLCITTAPMPYAIDVLFLSEAGEVTSVACDRGPTDPVVCADPARQVLELPASQGCRRWLGARLHRADAPPRPDAAEPPSASPSPAEATPAPADWFRDPIPPEKAPCEAIAPVRADRSVPLRLLLDEGASQEALLNQTRRLQGFYEPYGLRFELDGPVERVSVGPLMSGAPDSPEDLLAPLGDFIEQHARAGVITVALLPALAAPGSAADRYFSELDGLTLTPALVADREGLAPLAALGAFGPVILLSQADLAHRHPGHLDLTLAHELGHALGLPHGGGSRNLMYDGPLRCAPRLTADQLAAASWP